MPGVQFQCWTAFWNLRAWPLSIKRETRDVLCYRTLILFGSFCCGHPAPAGFIAHSHWLCGILFLSFVCLSYLISSIGTLFFHLLCWMLTGGSYWDAEEHAKPRFCKEICFGLLLWRTAKVTIQSVSFAMPEHPFGK